MKKILYILLTIGLFTSCDSLLDVEPETVVSYDNFFKTEQDLEVTLYQMQHYVNAYLMDGQRQIQAGFIEDGEYREQLYLWNSVSMLESIAGDWSGTYNVIYMSNVLLDNLHKAAENVTPERLAYYRAQAQFGKALAYFFLARRWGEVPITRNSTSSETYGKKPYLEVLDTAISNAIAAYKVLPVQAKLVNRNGATITSKQFGSKGSACALLAHAYAWKGSLIDLMGLTGDAEDCYTKSVEYATYLISGEAGDYCLVRNPQVLSNLFSDNEANNPEAIFDFTLDTQVEDIISSFLPAFDFMGYPIDPAEYEDMHQYKDHVIAYSTVEALYDEEDLRKNSNFYEYEYYKEQPDYITGGYVYPYKWHTGVYETDPYNPGANKLVAFKSNYTYWRLSDIYLLRAECNVKLGHEAPAISDLNEIRGYNLAKDYPNSKGDGQGLQYAVYHERERELLMEGHRFYDIVRNGMDYINDYLPGGLSTLTLSNVRKGALFLPIHEKAFKNNDLLIQNSYWAQFE